MTIRLDDAERRMIPRWRLVQATLEAGEFNPIVAAPIIPDRMIDPVAALSTLMRDWTEHPTLTRAADLISAALVATPPEHVPDTAREAATFVLKQSDRATPPLRRIAAHVAGIPAQDATTAEVDDTASQGKARMRLADPHAQIATRIARTRQRLHDNPFNPLAWVDLSRDYLTLGLANKAERAIQTALGLAGNHRFILRSATRLFVHRREIDIAWTLLRRSQITRYDPWLVAAEIAVAMIADRPAKFVKEGRAMLAGGHFSAFETSELASAIASLEVHNGAIRTGRKLFQRALINPTDNSVAQAVWTARHASLHIVEAEHLSIERSFEARAWEHFRSGQWVEAVTQAQAWFHDEPFSHRPLHLGTFVASTALGNHALAENMALLGLDANPDDVLLRNNLAFAMANVGKVAQAAEVLQAIPFSSVAPELRVSYVATWGLVCFRNGEHEEGRHLYRMAIDAARRAPDAEAETLATTYLAREELLVNGPDAQTILANATKLVKRNPRAHLQIALDQVVALAKARSVASID